MGFSTKPFQVYSENDEICCGLSQFWYSFMTFCLKDVVPVQNCTACFHNVKNVCLLGTYPCVLAFPCHTYTESLDCLLGEWTLFWRSISTDCPFQHHGEQADTEMITILFSQALLIWHILQKLNPHNSSNRRIIYLFFLFILQQIDKKKDQN